jgi:hypothetical protein
MFFNSPTGVAQPPVRLIIQFKSSLTTAQQFQLKEELNVILQSDFSILEHSSDERWIVKLNKGNQVKIEQAIKEIKQLQTVKYVEQDQVLNVVY